MDEQGDHLQAQYFGSADETHENPELHATPGGISAVTSITPDNTVETQFLHVRPPLNVSYGNLGDYAELAGSASSYPAAQFGTTTLPSGSWHSSSHSSLYVSDDSGVLVGDATLNPFGFHHHQYGDGHAGPFGDEQAMLFEGHDTVAPTTSMHMGYPYTWDTVNAADLHMNVDAVSFPPEDSSATDNAVSPQTGIAIGGVVTNSAPYGAPHDTHDSGSYTQSPELDATQRRQSVPGNIASGRAKSRRQPKRQKTSGSPMSPPSAAESSASSSRLTPASKARPGAGVVKASAAQPMDVPDDKRPRNAHNLVEKQYRNRLNAQFDGLMKALPDNYRTPESEAGDKAGADAAAEKRMSKAEVLDMARRHIRSLEAERDELAHERNELVGVVAKLQEEFAADAEAHEEGEDSGKEDAVEGKGKQKATD